MCFEVQVMNNSNPASVGLFTHPHQLLQAGEVDVIDAPLRRGSDVLLDVGSVHKRQVDLFRHIGGS